MESVGVDIGAHPARTTDARDDSQIVLVDTQLVDRPYECPERNTVAAARTHEVGHQIEPEIILDLEIARRGGLVIGVSIGGYFIHFFASSSILTTISAGEMASPSILFNPATWITSELSRSISKTSCPAFISGTSTALALAAASR